MLGGGGVLPLSTSYSPGEVCVGSLSTSSEIANKAIIEFGDGYNRVR